MPPQSPRRWRPDNNRKDHRGGRIADAGVVFHHYCGHRLSVRKKSIKARAAGGALRPAGGRGQILYRIELLHLLFAVGAGNNFLRCTDAEGGRERPGKACLGPAGRAQEVLIRAGLLGSRCKARKCRRPANRLLSGKEQCGAALRGHACDDISRISFPVPQILGTRRDL